MGSEPFNKFLEDCLKKATLKTVTFEYVDGTKCKLSAKEYAEQFKGKLVEGMFEDHRKMIEEELCVE